MIWTRRNVLRTLGGGAWAAARGDEGMSPEGLEAAVALYRRAVDRGEVAGAVLLVARHGSVVLHEAVGWRDAAQRLPMRKDTLFRMASNTKPVIAAAVLMLAEARRLSLDDYVRRYLPSFDTGRGREIRIRHLLSHTSGMRILDATGAGVIFFQPLLQKSAEHPDAPSLRAEVTRFGAVGAEKPPGSSYAYSDPGYNTLGAVIEAASGQALGAFLRERIYGPLGMADTWSLESECPNERMAVVYKGGNDGRLEVVWKPGDPPAYPFVRASGGMITTATDYLRFCRLFLDGGVGGGKRLLSVANVRAAITPAPHTEHAYRDGLSWYGYGWELFEHGVYGHHGSDGTFAWIDPRTGVIALALTQTQRGTEVRVEFLKAVAAAVRPGL